MLSKLGPVHVDHHMHAVRPVSIHAYMYHLLLKS